jgi:hypothetical protein
MCVAEGVVHGSPRPLNVQECAAEGLGAGDDCVQMVSSAAHDVAQRIVEGKVAPFGVYAHPPSLVTQ